MPLVPGAEDQVEKARGEFEETGRDAEEVGEEMTPFFIELIEFTQHEILFKVQDMNDESIQDVYRIRIDGDRTPLMKLFDSGEDDK